MIPLPTQLAPILVHLHFADAEEQTVPAYPQEARTQPGPCPTTGPGPTIPTTLLNALTAQP